MYNISKDFSLGFDSAVALRGQEGDIVREKL